MIPFKGDLKRMDYEALGEVTNSLTQETIYSRKYLDDISTVVYRMFKQMKSDFDNSYICIGDYHQLLRSLKTLFDKVTAPYQSALNADEILTEIKKQFPK